MGFNQFYKDNKYDADLAVSLPKWLIVLAIPKEEKKIVKDLSLGMQQIRLLVKNEDGEQLLSRFKTHIQQANYATYLYAKEDGTNVELVVKEEKEHVREIILSVQEEDDTYIISIQGKMKKERFEQKLSSVLSADVH